MILFLSMGSQVVGTGSNNISGFSWDYGTVGVSYECWGIWVSPSSVCSGVSVPQTIVGTTIKTAIVSSKGKSLGGKVSVFGCEDLWGLSWGNCTVGVGDELSAGNSDTCEENQEFHVCDEGDCASVQILTVPM